MYTAISSSKSTHVPIVQSLDINKSTSYAGVAGGSAKDQPNVNSNFRTLVADPVFDGVNISIPCKVVEKVSTRFKHTLYGYFIGKRMAFPVVEYYARNNWAKHGLKREYDNSVQSFFFIKYLIPERFCLEAVFGGVLGLIYSCSYQFLKEDGIYVKLLRSLVNLGCHVDDFTICISSHLKNFSKEKPCRDEYEERRKKKEDEEDVLENVYDESANLFQNIKAWRSSIQSLLLLTG
ncbi:hypothetical protein Tco_0613525 [Tanacetum coccineum]